MKNKRMKAKKKSYGYGTNSNYKIETPNEALVDYQLLTARAKAQVESDPLLNTMQMIGNTAMGIGSSMGGFGNSIGGQAGEAGLMALSNFAYGGDTGVSEVEVEGEEVAETPNGQLLDINGPKHENGGVDAIFPDGTTIYSDRIKVDGKTLAQRKKEREKKEGKIEKKAGGRKGIEDYLTKTTSEKTLRNIEKEEVNDLKVQEQVGAMMKQEEEGKQMAKWGDLFTGFFDGEKGNDKLSDFLGKLVGNKTNGVTTPDDAGYAKVKADFKTDTNKDFADLTMGINDEDFTSASRPKGEYNPESIIGAENLRNTPTEGMTFAADSPAPIDVIGSNVEGEGAPTAGLSTGDIIGMLGTGFSAKSALDNVNANRASDTPNVNSFKDFGQDALDKLDQAKTYLGGQEAKALKDAELSGRTNRARARSSARGINTMRATDLANEQVLQQTKASIKDMFAKQMMAMLSKEAGFENMQDQAVMSGEAGRDDADRRDKDQYYTNRGKALEGVGRAVQQTGKDLNVNKGNQLSLNLLNEMFQSGYIDKNGNIIKK